MPWNDPAKRLEYQRRWRANNPGKQREYNRAAKAKLRQDLKVGLKCARCGEDHPACLDFHHLDPSNKEGSVNRLFAKAGRERIKAEMAKCSVLCANCHRKEHANEYTSSRSHRAGQDRTQPQANKKSDTARQTLGRAHT